MITYDLNQQNTYANIYITKIKYVDFYGVTDV
jgi:hypothetical protein